MAQFDVYKNPSSKIKELYPYILDIQQPLLEVLAIRIVTPLGHPKYFKGEFMQYLTPEINFNNTHQSQTHNLTLKTQYPPYL